MRRIVLWSGCGLLVLVVAAITWLLLADLGRFKPQLERWASEHTGRRIAVNGDLSIDLGRHSRVTANDVVIANAEWAQDPHMLSIGRIEVRADLASVLRGPVTVELVDLDDAELYLEQAGDGAANWQLFEADAGEAKESAPAKDILFEDIAVDNVRLVYRSPSRSEALELTVEHLDEHLTDDEFLALSLRGALNGHRLALEGKIGTWPALIEGKNVLFDLDAEVARFEFSANGSIDDLSEPRRPCVEFVARAPDVNDLLRALGVQTEGEGVIDLAGAMTPEDGGPLALDIGGEFGRLEIEGLGTLSDLQQLDDMNLDLSVGGEDIRPILEALGLPQAKAAPFMLEVDAERHGPTMIIDRAEMTFGDARVELAATLPEFPGLDDSRIDLQIAGPDIERFRDMFGLPGAATGPFSLAFTVDVNADGVELLDLDVQTSLLELRADGHLGQKPDYFGTRLAFDFKSNSLADLAGAYGMRDLPDRPIVAAGSVEYTPDGVRTVDPIEADVNSISLSIDGLIQTDEGALGSDVGFRLTGPDLAKLVSAFATADGLPAAPYDLKGRVQVASDGYRLQKLGGSVGSTALNIDGLLVPAEGLAGSRAELAASGPALQELIARIGDYEIAPGSYELQGKIVMQPQRVRLDGIELRRPGGTARLDLELALPVSRNLATFTLQASGPDVRTLLRSAGDFEVNPAAFSIDVQGQRRGSLLKFGRAELKVADATLAARGELDLGSDTASRLDLAVDIPAVASLGSIGGRRMHDRAFSLDAEVRGGAGVITVDKLLVSLGDGDLRGKLRYEKAEVPRLEAAIESDRLVLAPLLEQAEAGYDPAPEFEDGRLIPDIRVPFEAMKKIDGSLDITIGDLSRDTVHVRDIVLRAGLEDGVLEVRQAEFRAKSGGLSARARLAPLPAPGAAHLELSARDFAPGILEFNRDSGMVSDINVVLDGSGDNLRDLLGTANGMIFWDARGGRMTNNRLLQAIYGDMLNQILSTINPFRVNATHTDFDCVILPLEIRNGTLSSEPHSLISTSKLQIMTRSSIDLKTEALDIKVRTTQKKGVSISAGEVINPYIEVVGTLASPRLAVDEKGILLSGGAAIATGGLSILARAAWSRLSRSDDPCTELSAEAAEALGDRLPDLAVPGAGSAAPDR